MARMYGLPNELYTMKRGVKRDRELRYDITEIPAGKINGQYNKTKGHIHSTGHQELYEVLEGHAYFLFQNDKDFYYVQATRGEYVLIPHNYYHITINVGRNTLKLGNWISDKCVSDYKYIEKMNGMCYYLGNNWSRNLNYNKFFKLKSKQALNNINYKLCKLTQKLN